MILLLYGKEPFLKEQAIAEQKRKLFPKGTSSDMDLQNFHAPKDAPSSVMDFLGTTPFLATGRMAIYRAVDELEEESVERLLAGFAKLPATHCLILETEQTNVKKDRSLAALAQAARIVACHTPFEKDLPSWLEQQAKKTNVALDRQAALYLASHGGSDLGTLSATLESLALYVHPRRTVKLEDVKALTQKNSQDDVFRLADMILDGRKKEALIAVEGLYRSGVRGPEMIAALAGQLDRYRRARSAAKAGRPKEEIGEELRIPRMFQPAFFSRLEKLGENQLPEMTKKLLDCDRAFKTGQAQERISVERFILTS